MPEWKDYEFCNYIMHHIHNVYVKNSVSLHYVGNNERLIKLIKFDEMKSCDLIKQYPYCMTDVEFKRVKNLDIWYDRDFCKQIARQQQRFLKFIKVGVEECQKIAIKKDWSVFYKIKNPSYAVCWTALMQ